jgi:YidC/Oxa1 family membrane protein insertase
MIAPSWHEKNLLEIMGMDLIKALLSRNYDVILRPHYKIAELNKKLLDELNDNFKSDSSFSLEIAGSNNNGIYTADLRIADYSGIAFEYAYTIQKPVLFLDSLPKIRNGEWTSLSIEPIEISQRKSLGKVVSLDLNNILNELEHLISNQSSFKNSIKISRDQYYFTYPSSVGKRAAKYIEELI